MIASEQLNELASALAKAQAKIKSPAKDKVAKVGQYSYRYCDLGSVIEAVHQPFADNGLSYVQGVSTSPSGAAVVTTRILHNSGQWIEDSLHMPVMDARPQAFGSAVTYGRRYGLSAMVGISPDDDDDGQTAQQGSKKPAPKAQGYNPEDPEMQQQLSGELERRGVPLSYWDDVGEAMRGKTSKDLDGIISNIKMKQEKQ